MPPTQSAKLNCPAVAVRRGPFHPRTTRSAAICAVRLITPRRQLHFAGLQNCCLQQIYVDTARTDIHLTKVFSRVELAPSGDRSAHEEAPMIFLMIECPSTGRIISTGITDGIDRLPKVGTRTQCPLCGQEHFWTSREVRFAESPSAKRKLAHKYQRFESSLA